HPGSRTVNVAISFYAESEVCELGDKGSIEIHLTDENYEQRYESLQQLGSDPKAALIHRALEYFHLTGVRITTRTDAPRGSGLAALHLNPGRVVRHEIALPMEKLSDHMLLHYTGVAHFSGTNNWQIYKRQIDGKKKVHKGLDKIAQSAVEMEKALESGNMEAAGLALRHEWENRKALIDGVSNDEIEAAIAAATGAGAWAGKVCGAGG